jgi:hypothetical protein
MSLVTMISAAPRCNWLEIIRPRLLGAWKQGDGTIRLALAKETIMPAKTDKQRKFMRAELSRKRAGRKTRTGMGEKKLEEMASKK